MHDLARYLAGRVSVLYSAAELAQRGVATVCAERDYPIIRADFVPAPGFCLRRMRPVIFVRPEADEKVTAHETFHAWVWENTSLGISYEPPEWQPDTEEAAADRFAAYLAGEEP